MIKFAFAVACLAHWQACAWFLLHVLENRGDGGITWVEALADGQGGTSLDLKPRFAQYVTCVYWSITTMTTIGYGDVVPSNRDERLFTVCAELAGSCVFLYGLTQVTQLIANFNVADVEFQRLMDQANEYFEFRNIPLPLRVKVREFFHYKRAGSLFHAEDELLSHLSDDIRVEVQLWSMRDVLNAVPFLREADERFVKLIVERLVRKVYAPREIVVRQGDVGHEMYFVAHGEVEVIAGGRRVAYLNEGAMIGEIAVAMRTRRTATVRTVTFTELLALSRPHFQRAAGSSRRRRSRWWGTRWRASASRSGNASPKKCVSSPPSTPFEPTRDSIPWATPTPQNANSRGYPPRPRGFRSRERRRECPSPREIAKHPIRGRPTQA